MYLQQVRLTNLKGFRDLKLKMAPSEAQTGGWYVILGENGTGKSTLLRAIALALAGRERAPGLLPDATGWVSDGLPHGSCQANLALPTVAEQVEIAYKVNSLPFEDEEHGFVSQPTILFRKNSSELAKHLYGEESAFLVAGYGPFRHLADSPGRSSTMRSDNEFGGLFYPLPLTNCERWLQSLDYARRSAEDESKSNLEYAFQLIITILNQLLPHPFQIQDVSPEGVRFSGPAGLLSLDDLSDGYRTMFGLGVDLLRRCGELGFRRKKNLNLKRLDDGTWTVGIPGIVLIDEAEVHLHPKWQREIGFYLQRAFPRIQFIVATHSPFVTQAATDDGIFILRREKNGTVTLDDTLDSVVGLRADQILSSPAFAMESTRDLETERLMERHGELRSRQLSGLELSPEERQELASLTSEVKKRLPRSGEQQA